MHITTENKDAFPVFHRWRNNGDKWLGEICICRKEKTKKKRERERERLKVKERVETKQLSSMGVQTAFKVFYFERDNRGWKTKGMGWKIKESRENSTRCVENLFISFPFSTLPPLFLAPFLFFTQSLFSHFFVSVTC